jgi:GAF domain-containing protein
MHDVPQPYAEERRRNPVIRPGPATAVGRALATKQPAQIADILNEPQYFDVPSGYGGLLANLGGARTVLCVPMFKDNDLTGAMMIYRQEVRPFTDKQIELVQNFAAQAVIAIENTRLLNELRQRTDDLSESLEERTASADVLKVIAGSPGNLAPVFDAVVERAMRLCEAAYGHIYTYDGKYFHLAVAHGESGYVEWIKQSGPRLPTSSLTFARIVVGDNVAHIGDISAEPSYRRDDMSRARKIVRDFGIHTVLSVALRKDGALLGTIVLYRQEPRPFTGKQIELVQNFAAQAVIAIENARLLNELRPTCSES